MTSAASIARHPIHPVLVAFPIGLWFFSFACDIIYWGTGNPSWNDAAWYCIGGGIIVAVGTRAIPNMMSRMTEGMMRGMMSRMREGGCDPKEM